MSALTDQKAETVVKSKNEAVARARPGRHDDLCPMVDVWRDGRFLAGIVCPEVDRDLALNAAQVAVPGFSADRVVLALDSHMSSSATNPSTGEAWGPGEMQGLCDNEDACDLGLITDAMVIHEVGRDGSWELRILPYHVHKTSRTIAWLPEVEQLSSETAGHELSGLVVEVVQDAFKMPTIYETVLAQLDEEAPGVDPPGDGKARLHCDLAVMKLLMAQDCAVAFHPDNHEDQAIIEESLREWTVTTETMSLLARLEGEANNN